MAIKISNVTVIDNDRKLFTSGGELGLPPTINTASSASSTSHLIIKRSGAGAPTSFGAYDGAWRSGIEVWNNDSTRMLFLNPPDTDSVNYAHIKSVGGGIQFGVGSNGSTVPLRLTDGGTAQFYGTLLTPTVWVNYATSNNNDYNENIRLFPADNGVAVIAYGASGVNGIPWNSTLGYSDRFEIRQASQWQLRSYADYVEAFGSFRAPIFYDSDNTSYHLDPSAASSAYSLFSNGIVVAGQGGFQTRYYASGRNRIWSFNNADGYGISYFQGSGGLNGADSIGVHFGNATADNSSFNFATNPNALVAKASFITSLGGGASSSTKHIDLINGTGYDLFMLPRAGSGSYNPLVNDGDAVIGFSAGSVGTGALSIVPWSDTNTGIRLLHNGVTTLRSSSDNQLSLIGNDTWAGIAWYDQDGSDYLWYRGSTSTFSIGGGGSVVTGKKLHVNGATSIGNAVGGTVVNSNSLLVEESVTARIFYDRDNTNYYNDPADVSIFNKVRASKLATTYHSLSSAYFGGGSTPTTGYLITTDIPYNSFNMPTVIIEGYAYGNAIPIHLEIVWYSYSDTFVSQSYTNLGAWNPGTITLATNGDGKICIHLSNNIYYGRFNVRCIADTGTQFLENWTVTEATTSGMNRIVTVPSVPVYSSIKGTVYYTEDSTYYLNPGSDTSLRTVGDWRANSSAWTGEFSGKIQYHASNWYFQAGDSFIWRNAGGTNVFYGNQSGDTTSVGSSRAPIFYDSNDTNYYLDPASVSNEALRVRGGARFGPNTTWGASLFVGTDGRAGTEATVAVTNGNLHIDSKNGYSTYLNWYSTENIYSKGYFGVGDQTASYRLHVHGTGYATSDFRAPIFYDSDDTNYYANPAGISNFYGLAIRGDASAVDSGNQIFFWGTGDTTTSAIGFKSNGGEFSNPTGNGDGYNTYLTMDTEGRGWVFRRGTGGGDFNSAYTAGWILNNGLAQFNSSVRSPVFYDSNDTNYYADPASTSVFNNLIVGGRYVQKISSVYSTTITAAGWHTIASYDGGRMADTLVISDADSSRHNYVKVNITWSFGQGGITVVQATNYSTLTIRHIRLCYNTSDQTYGGVRVQVYCDNPSWTLNVQSEGQGAPSWGTAAIYNTAVLEDPPSGFAPYARIDEVMGRGNLMTSGLNYGGRLGAGYDSGVAGSVNSSDWFRNQGSGTGLYNNANGNHWYSDSGSYWNMTMAGGSAGGIRFRDTHQGTVRGYVYYDTSNNVGFLNNDGNWRLRVVGGDYTLADGSSIRGQIYYDSNDTNYYLDPASTSNINSLYIQGGVGGTANDSSYSYAAVEIRERGFGGEQDNTWATAPRLSFHWGGRVASQIALHSSGRIHILNNPGNNVEDFEAASMYGNAFYDRNDTGYYLDPASTTTSLQIAGAIEQGPDFAHPNVEWSASGNSTGMVVFKLPGTSTNYGMVHMVFDYYEYDSTRTATIIVGGHNWNSAWYNTGCNVIGNLNKEVRLGYKDGQYCVVFGAAGSSWNYGTVRLRKIHNGTFYSNIMNLGGTYSVAQTTTESFTNVTGDLRELRTPASFTAGGPVSGSRVWAGFDSGITGSVSADNWFRSSGGTGWYNSTYSGGIYMEDSTWVRVYNNKQFYSQNFIQSDSSVRAPIFYDSNDTTYYTDPAGTSNLAGLTVANTISGTITNANNATNASNAWALGTDTASKSSSLQYWQMSGNATLNPTTDWHYGLRMSHGDAETYYSATFAFNFFSDIIQYRRKVNGVDASWITLLHSSNYTSYAMPAGSSATNSVDIRAPIFYDSDDTSYYTSPNGSSVLRNLTISSPYATGDANGIITTNRYLAKAAPTSGGATLSHSDFDPDSEISSADALSLLRLVIGQTGSLYPGVTLALQHSDTTKKVGIGFIQHTAFDILKIATGATPLYANIGPVGLLVGYADDPQAPRDVYCSRDVANDSIVNTVRSVGTRYFHDAIHETSLAVAASDIDLSQANLFSKTISGTTTFTVSNIPATGMTATFILDLTNGGSATINWWSGVKWAGGTAPTLTSSGRDVLGFFTYDGGTTWTGLVLGKDVK